MSRLTTSTKATAGPSATQKVLDNVDIRYHGARPLRTALNKVFPSHWSFMLGEAALYSFLILLLSGVYLTLFFDPSMAETVYQGVYEKLRGVPMRAEGRPFEIDGTVGGTAQISNGDSKMTLEFTGLRVINVENLGGNPAGGAAGTGATDVRKVDLFSSLQNAIAFAKSNDIPIPADATKALGAL